MTSSVEQRERAVEWIIESVDGCARHWAEIITDHLIAKGAIFPPCKVGDTVYTKYHLGGAFNNHIISGVAIENSENIEEGLEVVIDTKSTDDQRFYYRNFADVFLTEAEAERALRERDNK